MSLQLAIAVMDTRSFDPLDHTLIDVNVATSFDPLDHALQVFAKLNSDESDKLIKDSGISSFADLTFLKFEDFKPILPSASTILKLRKLEAVVKFINTGNTLDTKTTIFLIREQL